MVKWPFRWVKGNKLYDSYNSLKKYVPFYEEKNLMGVGSCSNVHLKIKINYSLLKIKLIILDC